MSRNYKFHNYAGLLHKFCRTTTRKDWCGSGGVFVLRYTGKSLTFKEIAAIQKEIATILRPKNIPIDFNSLDLADLWIKKLLEHFPDRIEYIHYKKI